ncbi:MAG: TetR family transcriptional regulator [Acidimicrobiia bacterium]|nr:TetR family transcriptional regulator [Acidimicrobiia bacterium]
MRNVVAELADQTVKDRRLAYAAEIRALLDAALEVMRRDETIDPTVTDIVSTAGLSNQTFYRHFRGKDELFIALLADGRERMADTIERRMERAADDAGRVRAWVEAVLAQARNQKAAAATRPFVANADRLGESQPEESERSRIQLVKPLADVVGDADAVAVYNLAMGAAHDAIIERRVPTSRDLEHIVQFALKGCELGD